MRHRADDILGALGRVMPAADGAGAFILFALAFYAAALAFALAGTAGPAASLTAAAVSIGLILPLWLHPWSRSSE